RAPATLVLPGSVQAYYEAPIYARTSGYLKTWYTDIGAPVKKGQLLAEIEPPAADNRARLHEVEGFKRVVAPFDGVVTQRNTDVGALINAGQTPGSALFRVADTHRLRIYVSGPQSYSGEIHSGLTADLVFAARPGQ